MYRARSAAISFCGAGVCLALLANCSSSEAKAPALDVSVTGGGSMGGTGTQATGGTPHFDGGSASFGDCKGPVGAIRFSVASGTFEGSITVELGSDVPNAEIRYTTDRTLPQASSPLYTGPLTIDSTTDLRAQPFLDGFPAGLPSSAVYVARNFDATHDLPVVVLDSYGVPPRQNVIMGGAGGGPGTGPIVVREFVDSALLSYEPGEGMTSLSAVPTLATSAATHIRGQSSAFYDKRPYRLELRHPDGGDRDCTLLGMPAESDWVLHSPFPDKALIRNAFVYGLGRDMGLAAPRAAFAEVYVNDSARPLERTDYQGVYLIVETIKVDPDRLDLNRLTATDTHAPDFTGGYVFKFDWQVTGIDQLLTCPSTHDHCWNWLDVVEPGALVPEQRSFLTQYLQKASASLHSKVPADPAQGYPSMFDTRSLVDHVIVNELTRNLDAYTRSQFFYKDRDGKLFAGPLWDFDLSAGVGIGDGGNVEINGFQYENNYGRLIETADWFWVLMSEPSFQKLLVTRWKELRSGLLSDEEIAARIERLTAPLASAARRNFEKWNILEQEKVVFFYSPALPTWEGQVAFLREWLIRRAAFLDSHWD